jgi:methylamine---glutamate N-methyltransferase subunit A
MCGIAGLFGKSPVVTEHLGEHLGAMLSELNDRGPDSAGVAIYRDPAPVGASKVSLFSPDPRYEWGAVRDGLAAAFGGDPEPEVRASHAVFVVDADAERTEAWLRDRHPELRIMSVGERIEIFK